jgi:hypothetical protein
MEKVTFRALCLIILLSSTSVFSQNGEVFIGQVYYHDNYPLSGVTAQLRAPGGNIIATDVTDTEGYFEFTNITPGNYTVTFTTQQPSGGVELSDAYLVMQKILGQTTLTPIQTLAADVNCSGTITWADYWMIVISYLNQGNPFPSPWVFESMPVTIPSPSRDGFTLGGGSSSGDVNGSLQPDPKSNSIFLNNPVEDLTAGSADPIPFNLESGQNLLITGMHLEIGIPEDLIVTGVDCVVPAANISLSEDHITVTWLDKESQGFEMSEGSPLLLISTKATKLSRDGGNYSLKLDDDSHFIDSKGDLVHGVSLNLPTISLNLQNEFTQSVYPNPFISHTTFEYQVPQEGQVIILLFDQTGREVMEVENNYVSAGTHQVKFDGSALLPGIYYYQVRYSGNEQGISTGTMIKSK